MPILHIGSAVISLFRSGMEASMRNLQPVPKPSQALRGTSELWSANIGRELLRLPGRIRTEGAHPDDIWRRTGMDPRCSDIELFRNPQSRKTLNYLFLHGAG
jgi:hypothetical protein